MCRLSCCRDGAVYVVASAPWRVFCHRHARQLLGWLPTVELRVLEANAPRCTYKECRRPAAVLVSMGRPRSRRRVVPPPEPYCLEHGRALFADADESARMRRLPLNWTPPPDAWDEPTYRAARAAKRKAA
jgi:hypothetical protein